MQPTCCCRSHSRPSPTRSRLTMFGARSKSSWPGDGSRPMTNDDEDTAAELAPVDEIDGWLGNRLEGSGPTSVRRVTTGHSNEMFEVSRGGARWMLRRPPRVLNAPTA